MRKSKESTHLYDIMFLLLWGGILNLLFAIIMSIVSRWSMIMEVLDNIH